MIYLTSVNEIMSAEAAETDACLAGVAQKDSEALERLYHLTSAAVYGLALSTLKNTHDAEDVLHDCYVSIWSAAGQYRSAGKPLAWILTITRNLCLMKLRERKRSAEVPQEDWEDYLVACEGMSSEDKLTVTECMSLLSDEERQIVVLHAVAGFRHREIAQVLSLPLATVLSKYSRAVKKLKKAYEERNDEGGLGNEE